MGGLVQRPVAMLVCKTATAAGRVAIHITLFVQALDLVIGVWKTEPTQPERKQSVGLQVHGVFSTKRFC